MTQREYVFSTRETVHYRFPTHTNDMVMDRAEAETSEVFVVVLEPGEGPPLHLHHDTEQIFFVLEGTGILQLGSDPDTYPVGPGDVVRIPPHTPHRIQCHVRTPLRYLSVDCFLAGRPKEEPTWESHVKAVCTQNGWDFAQVTGKSG